MEKRNQIYYCDYYDEQKIGQSSSKPGKDQNDDEKTMPKSTSHSTITVFTAKITRRSKCQWGVFSFQCSPANRAVASVCADFRTPVLLHS